MIPWSGPPGAPRASTRRSISGSSTRGGAWCGLIRASITSGPGAAPVLLVDEGADAVDVGRRVRPGERHPEEVPRATGRRTRCRRPGRPAGTPRSGRPAGTTAQNARTARAVARGRDGRGLGRPGRPGSATRGSPKPSGSRRPAGTSVGKRPALRPGGGDHDLRALVQAVARVVEGVDRRPGLEVEVVRPVDPLQDVAEEGGDVVDVEARGRPPWRR